MLPEYLDRFNQTLESFRQRFPAKAWSDEFSQSLINDFSFYSTRIEEEAIEYGDTIKFLKDELVQKVHLKGLLEVSDHQRILEALIQRYDEFELSEDNIKQVHRDLMQNELSWEDGFRKEHVGEYRNHPVVGRREPFYANKEYVSHFNIEFSMASYVDIFQQKLAHIDNSSEENHLITVLAYFHNKFLNLIHPFADGNGRTARIIMGVLMMKNNCPPVFSQILSTENMFTYINTLIECEQQDSDVPFVRFLANGMCDYMTSRL